MSEELLSLKWNNHQSHFVDILTFLREQEIFIDATLACGGKLYPAHKFVLSTCSEYFKQMFTHYPSKHPIVFMKDVTCRDLEALLDFMYNGEVNVPQSSLGSLIKTAEGLQIKGLAVPDDPPAPKKEKKKNSTHLDHYLSPPPKRLKVRERSPHRMRSASSHLSENVTQSTARSKSPPISSVAAADASADEDSRTSAHSGLSDHSHSLNSKANFNNVAHSNEESTDNSDNVPHKADEPSPGPSGIHRPQSKEEELDIKQEEVVDLDDEEGDWGNEVDGGGGDGLDLGGDGSLESDNAQFSDAILPPGDSSLPSADHAMISHERHEEGEYRTASDPLQISHLDEESDLSIDHRQMNYSISLPVLNSDFKPFVLTSVLSHSGDDSSVSPQERLNARDIISRESSPSMQRVCKPTTCPICGRSVLFFSELKKHMRIHTGERPYQCHLCPYRSAQSSNLNVHVKTWLTSSTLGSKDPPELEDLIVPPSNAPSTSRLFLSEIGSLSYSHWLQTIKNSFPSDFWTCGICKKIFGTRYYYERHLKCHFNEKEQCPYCPFRSTYKWNLKSHIRNRHIKKESVE